MSKAYIKSTKKLRLKRKEEALDLARLLYDIYTDNLPNDKIDSEGSNLKNLGVAKDRKG